MSTTDSRNSPLGIFERWLSLWVALAIAAGLVLGNLAPAFVAQIASLEVAKVNLVVAVLIWAMIYPMMVGVDFASIRNVGRKPRGLIITLVINCLSNPSRWPSSHYYFSIGFTRICCRARTRSNTSQVSSTNEIKTGAL
ncbi:MAG: hypothetical protein KJS73_07695 [Gammaproteobacteria bacterium]|nr:hypothetical protein [Gammaproteobacteria bacterium]